MFRRSLVAGVLVLAFIATATPVWPATAATSKAVVTHKLIVVVKKNLPQAAERKLAVLVLISQNNGPPSAAVVTARRPLTVYLDNRGLFRIKAELDVSCKGSCAASYRVSGAANHELKVVPSCQLKGSAFVCSRIGIVKVY